MGRVGLEHPQLAQSEAAISTSGGAKSDALNAPNIPQTPQDPDLAMVVERWPKLPEQIKAAFNALIQTNSKEAK